MTRGADSDLEVSLAAQPSFIIDDQGLVIAWNSAMQQLTGRSAKQVQGQALNKLGRLPKALYVCWGQVKARSQENRVALTDKEQLYSVVFAPLPTAKWMVMLEPQQTDSSPKSLNDMVNIVAHELQNPLAAMKGYVELITHSGTLNDRQQHFVNRALNAVDDMSELVSRLLDVAWLDSEMALKLAPVNLAYLVKAVAESFNERAQSQGVKLAYQLEAVPPVMIEERRMKQVITNLIGNAIKYSPDGGTVSITVTGQGAAVGLEIRDEGLGIPPEYQARIFERFFRVPNQYTRNIAGNGLGLAISYEIVQKHGGKLAFESNFGQGSRFYFSLPALENGEDD